MVAICAEKHTKCTRPNQEWRDLMNKISDLSCDAQHKIICGADANTCVWMEEELNHPLNDVDAHTSAYLTVSLMFIQFILLV